MRIREYGTSGPPVIVLHGGPGAPGSAAGLARGLAGEFRVCEPFQRGSPGPNGEDMGHPLTVALHVADLDRLVDGLGAHSRDERPALVGHSWGAMLALAYAAAHPGRVAALALVGCGTFDETARARLHAICDERMDGALRRRLRDLEAEFPDPDVRLRVRGELLEPLYSYDAVGDEASEPCDGRANRETWGDMLELEATGVYPAAFAAIDVPVLMLHGAYDPHPGRMIRASLEPHIRRLEYREWESCGHYPWRERAVRDDFFAFLRAWLRRWYAGEDPPIPDLHETSP
jgi:pimeloyl-ACP methyl ester carboxylesterase